MGETVNQRQANPKGFAALRPLLLLIIVAIIAGVGYYVWHSNKNASDTLNSASRDSQNASSATIAKNTEALSTKRPVGYLEIKEWGVKLPLINGDAGAYYSYNSSIYLHNALYDSVSIFDKNIDQAKNDDGKSCKDPGYPLFVISRAKTNDVNTLRDSKSPNFIGEMAPANFKALSFSKDYEFAGSSFSEAIPPCMVQKSGKLNSTLQAQYQQTKNSLTSSYNGIQAL
jgi:hypothetical protein